MTAWREDAVFTHLIAMSDDCGVFEHARHDRPRREEGYCVDDVARALVVLAREPRLGPDEERLASICVAFVDENDCAFSRRRQQRRERIEPARLHDGANAVLRENIVDHLRLSRRAEFMQRHKPRFAVIVQRSLCIQLLDQRLVIVRTVRNTRVVLGLAFWAEHSKLLN